MDLLTFVSLDVSVNFWLKTVLSNIKTAFEWQQGKKYCATADPYKTDTGARGRMWYPHSEEEQKRVGRWLVGKVIPEKTPIFISFHLNEYIFR